MNFTGSSIPLTSSYVWGNNDSRECNHTPGAFFVTPSVVCERLDGELRYRVSLSVRGRMYPSSYTGAGGATTTRYKSLTDDNTYIVSASIAGGQASTFQIRTTPFSGVWAAINEQLDRDATFGTNKEFTVSTGDYVTVSTDANDVSVTYQISYVSTSGSQVAAFTTRQNIALPAPSQAVRVSDSYTLGQSATMKVTRSEAYTSALTHTVQYSVDGGENWTEIANSVSVATNATESSQFTWSVPVSLASLNTTGTTIPATIRCITYLGSETVGYYSTPVILNIPDSSSFMPSFTFTVTPYSSNPNISQTGMYYAGYTALNMSVDASGKYGATITNYKFFVGSEQIQSGTRSTAVSDIIDTAGSVSCAVEITDSRGFTLSQTLSRTFRAYTKPNVTILSCFRCDSAGNRSDDAGEYLNVSVRVSYTFSGSSPGQDITATVTYSQVGSTQTTTVPLTFSSWLVPNDGSRRATATNDTAIIGGGSISKSRSYTVVFTVADWVTSQEFTITIPGTLVPFNIKEGGNAVAFGSYATIDDSVEISGGYKFIVNQNIYGDELPSGSNESNGRVFFHVEDGGTGGFHRCTPYVYTDGTYDETDDDTHPTLFDLIYPVGSIYMSTASTDPGLLFGGTWERIQDTFLLAAGSTYAAGGSGGKDKFKMSVSELPNVTGSFRIRPAGSNGNTAPITQSTGVFSGGNTLVDVANGNKFDISAASGGNTKSQLISMSFGSGADHENMPPYIAVYVWKRTALKRPTT